MKQLWFVDSVLCCWAIFWVALLLDCRIALWTWLRRFYLARMAAGKATLEALSSALDGGSDWNTSSFCHKYRLIERKGFPMQSNGVDWFPKVLEAELPDVPWRSFLRRSYVAGRQESLLLLLMPRAPFVELLVGTKRRSFLLALCGGTPQTKAWSNSNGISNVAWHKNGLPGRAKPVPWLGVTVVSCQLFSVGAGILHLHWFSIVTNKSLTSY